MAPTMRTGKIATTEEPLRRRGNGYRSYHRPLPRPASRGRDVEGPTAIGRNGVGEAAETGAPAHPHLAAVRGARQVGPTPGLGRARGGQRLGGHDLVEKSRFDRAVGVVDLRPDRRVLEVPAREPLLGELHRPTR